MRASGCRGRSPWQTRFRGRQGLEADKVQEASMLKGLALWALGIPLPIILILYLFNIL